MAMLASVICPHCGSTNVRQIGARYSRYRPTMVCQCESCQRYFDHAFLDQGFGLLLKAKMGELDLTDYAPRPKGGK